MDVTEFGIIMEVNPIQYPKAFSPMVIIEFGIDMEVMLLQS